MHKWLNISAKESDYSADASDEEEDWDPDPPTLPKFGQWRRGSRFKNIKKDESEVDDPDGNVARTVASIFYLHYSNIILRL
ncbi:hypothetical protein M0R45_002482 [Rubus argutus]|uniref:Uncharacterized protein n=1 Tax=Rubus argutus TaxID=59490 RepID=A0AAW1VRI3_RUBAR